MRTTVAAAPFFFNSSAHLLRATEHVARSIRELLQILRTCPDECIFQHTFQTLAQHHFLHQTYSNDFAHWVVAACGEHGLSEHLAAIDVREFTSLAALRQKLVATLQDFVQRSPNVAERRATDPFYFCASQIVVIPTGISAADLPSFAAALDRVTIRSIHYHVIDARLRLRPDSNDFSEWITAYLGMPELAQRLNRIDIYTNTLEGVRQTMLRILRTHGQSQAA